MFTLVEPKWEDVEEVATAEEAVDAEGAESVGAVGRVHGLGEAGLLEGVPVRDHALLAVL